jgi:hypothetical protein
MSLRYTQAQAQSLGLLPSPPVRRSRKTHTADGHAIDPAWLWMNEEGKDGFRAEVMKLVHRGGWSCGYKDEGELPGLALHLSSAMHQPEKGWPDLTLLRRRDRRVLLRELKREDGELAPRQAAVLDLLRACGLDADVWRPSQLEAIAEMLR